jgi:hypothetical protein
VQFRYRDAEPDLRVGAAAAERLVERRLVDRRAASDVLPVAADVDVGQRTASVVEEPLPHDRVRAGDRLRSVPRARRAPARSCQASTGRLRPHPLQQALGRLLGPAGPEIGCDDCFEELDRYVELQVAGRDADAAIPGFRAHLEGCPACREEHESLYALVSGEQAL